MVILNVSITLSLIGFIITIKIYRNNFNECSVELYIDGGRAFYKVFSPYTIIRISLFTLIDTWLVVISCRLSHILRRETDEAL